MERIFNVMPVSKPRMTQRDKWAKRDCVLKYYNYKDSLRLQGRNYELPNEFRVVFGVPFPRTYSRKKREELLGQPHRVKPDIDNYVKGLLDAFCDDDSGIWHIDCKKIWTSGAGFILIDDFNEQPKEDSL